MLRFFCFIQIKITLESYSAIQPYICSHCFLFVSSFETVSIQICAKSHGVNAPSSNFFVLVTPVAAGGARIGAGGAAGSVRFLDLISFKKS